MSDTSETEDRRTPFDVPTVRVKANDGSGYQVINRADFDPKKHELIKGGEDQEQGLMTGASERNPSGTFSEPTPTDIRFPNKDATEFENNHGAFVRKSAAQMREDHGMPDAPGGLYPDGEMRIEAFGPNQHRVMSGTREVLGGISTADAKRFQEMKPEEREEWVKSRGGNPPDMKAAAERRDQLKAAREGRSAPPPGTRVGPRGDTGRPQPSTVSPGQPPVGSGQQSSRPQGPQDNNKK